MTMFSRRNFLVATAFAVPALHLGTAWAVDALPDARFVGFGRAVNDFDIASGQMALQRSCAAGAGGSPAAAERALAASLLEARCGAPRVPGRTLLSRRTFEGRGPWT